MNQLGTPPTRIEQLPDVRADVAHFWEEYEARAPFTPNNYGCQEQQ